MTPRLAFASFASLAALLGGCPVPEPRDALLVFDVRPDVVTLEAKLGDLQTAARDDLDSLNALTWVLTPERLAAAAAKEGSRLWLSPPSQYALLRRADALDLHFTASFLRADFDACLRLGCTGEPAQPAVREMCASFPLQRCGAGKYQARLEDGYVVKRGTPSSWPAKAKRIQLKVTRDPRGGEHSLGAAYDRLGKDQAAALRARALMHEVTIAFKANDRARIDELINGSATLPPALRALPAVDVRRLRLRTLHDVLAQHDPRELESPSAPTFADELSDHFIPRASLAIEALWGLRALYEVAHRVPAAFEARRDSLCMTTTFAAQPARDLCASLGYLATP